MGEISIFRTISKTGKLTCFLITYFSACGQLVQKKEKEEESKEPIDIEDVIGATETSQKKKMTSNLPEQGNGMEYHEGNSTTLSSPSWIKSMSTENLDRLDKALTVAACVSASCFLTSTWLYAKKR